LPPSSQSRSGSPWGGSTFITSAPRSPSWSETMLPATRRDRSSTRTPSSGPVRPASNVTAENWLGLSSMTGVVAEAAAEINPRGDCRVGTAPKARAHAGPRGQNGSYRLLRTAKAVRAILPPLRRRRSVQRLPYGARGRRHVDVADAGLAVERIDDGVDRRRRRADGAGLARALDAERIRRARHVVGGERERRASVGARPGGGGGRRRE